MDAVSEQMIQRAFAETVYSSYKDDIDGIIGFTEIPIAMGAPDLVIISNSTKTNIFDVVTLFEVKKSVSWQHIGQIYRYSLYAPTYLVVPSGDVDEIEKNYTLVTALKGLGVGLIVLDMAKHELNVVMKPRPQHIQTHLIHESILWWLLELALDIASDNRFEKVYSVLIEAMRSGTQ